jgi:hypothetical protein
MIALVAVLIARLLMLALLIRLRFAWLELWLLLRRLWRKSWLLSEVGEAFALVAFVGLRRAVLAFWPRRLLWLTLAELFLRRRDQAKIVFGVLVVILRRYRIARGACVSRELDILLCDMRGGSSNFDIRSIGFENSGHRVLAAPVVIIVVIIIVVIVVAATHTLVVVRTVSHFCLLSIQVAVIDLVEARRIATARNEAHFSFNSGLP